MASNGKDGGGNILILKESPLFFSANSEKIDIKLGLDSGADDYLTKLFELVDLLNSIEQCRLKKRLL